MSLQLAAQHLAAQGRGPDTTLVHMTPGEVKGLQAIAMAHGGSLTVNPQTGLPEAGFLSSLLPMIAGIALGPAGFGLTAMQAGLATGALTGLATGSLRKGLMAGLGAYGGAGIGDVVGKAGTGAISAGANAPLPPVSDAGTMLAQIPASPVSVGGPMSSALPEGMALSPLPADVGVTVGGPMSSALPQATALPPASFDPFAGYPSVPASAESEFVGLSKATTPTPITPQPAAVPPSGASYGPVSPLDLREVTDQQAVANKLANATPTERFTKGLGAIADKPSLLFNKENLKYGAAALAPMMFPEQKAVDAPRDTEQYRYAYNPNRDMPPTRMGDVGEYRYFNPSYTRLAADGGIMSAMPVQRMSDANNAEMLALNRSQMYAKGGISHLGDYSDGGRLLRGPGDGVSDSIPATIANKRPARLADGEFVVPARIVSELGNGSTDAGARKLYAMMNRVQKNRGKTVGKGKVAVNSRSEKLLPA